MRKLLCLSAISAMSFAPALLNAQEEPVRTFCDDADAANECPGDDCLCVDDTMEIVFEGQLENSIWEYEAFNADDVIPGRVVIGAVSEQIRGYSFGIRHNTEDINPLLGPSGLNVGGDPNIDAALGPDTASLPARAGGFLALRLIVSEGVRLGFICAVVLNFSEPVVLPVGRQTVVNANYQLVRDVGAEGTMLTFAQDLGDPATQVVLTIDKIEFPDMVDKDEGNCVDGQDNDFDGLVDRDDPDCMVRNGVSRVPRQLVEGLVKGPGGPAGETDCADGVDNDEDGMTDCDDSDCAEDPACVEPDPETDCADGVDNDEDGMTDCDDSDCAEDPACVQPDPETDCADGVDNDEDGMTDCDDSDCAEDPACVQPDPETDCADGVDNDEDGMTDCDDSDCAEDPACVQPDPETDCADGVDNDEDGMTDCEDSDCADDAACQGDCPDYALYFGGAASTAPVAVGEDGTIAVSMRNALPSSGFQFGIKVEGADGAFTWSFTNELGGTADTLVELIIADNANPLPMAHTPETPNTGTSTSDVASAVAKGAALSGFPEGSDTLLIDRIGGDNGGVGGTGVTVGYVADINNDGTDNVIAATAGDDCSVNEILVVTVGGPPPVANFSRADANGDSKINVVDAIIIIQLIIGNIPAPFNCDSIYDANDNGQLDLGDGVMPLNYVFGRGPALADPFRSCGPDGTPDDLTCTQPNCQ